jgi:hypothetical protein
MRKGQIRWVSRADVRRQNQFINKLFGLRLKVATLPFLVMPANRAASSASYRYSPGGVR